MAGFDFAALERRVAALEARQAASLRFGRVTGVDGGKCRVQLRDGQGVVSQPLSTVQRRVLKDQDICMPDIGEPVACLVSGQGCEEGVVLGAYYNAREQAPGQPASHDYRRYEDGTEIFYDRARHRLIARVRGDIEVETDGHALIRAKKEVRAESETAIVLRAPAITLAGLLYMTDRDGNPGRGELLGDFRIRQGGLSVPDADVTAGAVSVRGHVHKGVEAGPDTSDRPVGG